MFLFTFFFPDSLLPDAPSSFSRGQIWTARRLTSTQTTWILSSGVELSLALSYWNNHGSTKDVSNAWIFSFLAYRTHLLKYGFIWTKNVHLFISDEHPKNPVSANSWYMTSSLWYALYYVSRCGSGLCWVTMAFQGTSELIWAYWSWLY